MGNCWRQLPTLFYGLILLVSTMVAGLAEGGARWEPRQVILARATGLGSQAPVVPMEEAIFPQREDLRLVLFVPMPEPELRPGAKPLASLATVIPTTEVDEALGRLERDRRRAQGQALQQREWQPPPRAPDILC